MSKKLTWCLIRRYTEKLCLSGFQVSTRNVFYTRNSFTGYDVANFDYGEIKSFKEFVDERKISLARAVIALVKELNISRETALHIVNEWKALTYLPKTSIRNNIHILQEENFDQATIIKNIYAIADSTNNLQRKIDILKSTHVDMSSAIHLLKLPISSFNAYSSHRIIEESEIPEFKNRIEYLATKLETTTAYICSKFSSYPFLFSCNIKKLVQVTDFLIDCGIKPQYIADDLVIYKYSSERIRERVLRAKKADIIPLRPWVVRCPIELVQKAEKKRIEKATFFKSCETIEEYIAELMNCNIELVEGLLRRNPNIKSINLTKLTNKLIMLRDFGFTMNDIFAVPRIFHCKDSTLRKKFKEWKAHNETPPALFALSLSKTVFQRELEKKAKRSS